MAGSVWIPVWPLKTLTGSAGGFGYAAALVVDPLWGGAGGDCRLSVRILDRPVGVRVAVSRGFPDGSAPTDRDSPPGTATRTTGSRSPVAVSFGTYQPAVTVRTFPDAFGVVDDHASYLFLSVDPADAEDPVGTDNGTGTDDPAVAEDPPAPSEFAFRFAGRTFAPVDLDETHREFVGAYENEGAYRGRSGGWLLFELPETGEAGEARLTWPGGAWRLGRTLRRRLAAPDPDLSLSFSAPETVRYGGTPRLSLTVTNRGDLPGRFVAALNRGGPSVASVVVATVSMLVPPGERRTWEHADDSFTTDWGGTPDGDHPPALNYSLSSSLGGFTHEVEVETDRE